MQGMYFVVPYFFNGTMSGNRTVVVHLPISAQLQRVQFSNTQSTASTVTLARQVAADGEEETLATLAILDSHLESPYSEAAGDFSDVHFRAGELLKAYIDYDGAGGDAAENVNLIFWFTEG